MEQVPDDDELSLPGVHARHDLAVEPAVGLVAVLLRPDPFAVLRVVHDDEPRPVLEMAQAADLLAAGPGEDADAVREDDVLLLPFLAVAFQGEVLDHVPFDLAVVLLDERVRFELVLDRGDVQGRLPGGIGDEDDEGIFLGVFERGPQGKGQRAEGRFARAAEADDEETAVLVVLKGVDKLGMEGRRRVGEVAGEIDQRKAEEGLAALFAAFERVVGEAKAAVRWSGWHPPLGLL